MAANSTPDVASVTEPFPIFKLAHRYMLYDIATVTHVRTKYNILGVLVGTLPQATQQNVFLGLPLELQPEEARLLVDKGVAFVVDDTAEHKRDFLGVGGAGLSAEERKVYQATLRKQGLGAAGEAQKRSADRKQAALKKHGDAGNGAMENWNDMPDDMYTPGPRRRVARKPSRLVASGGGAGTPSTAAAVALDGGAGEEEEDDDPDANTLFASPSNSFPTASVRSQSGAANRGEIAVADHRSDLEPYGITPTTSYFDSRGVTAPSSTTSDAVVPAVPSSFPVFRHLHAQGYFLAPGLRFGCRYMAYPGDPLRFHSHFLCDGMGWDDEFDLLGLIAGGRLGTGVKKGYLIGGEPGPEEDVRTFCIEWGGM